MPPYEKQENPLNEEIDREKAGGAVMEKPWSFASCSRKSDAGRRAFSYQLSQGIFSAFRLSPGETNAGKANNAGAKQLISKLGFDRRFMSFLRYGVAWRGQADAVFL